MITRRFKCGFYQWFCIRIYTYNIHTCARAHVDLPCSCVHVDQIVCSHARWLYRIIWEVRYCVLSPHERSFRVPPPLCQRFIPLLLVSSSVDEELLTGGDGQPVGHSYIHHKKSVIVSEASRKKEIRKKENTLDFRFEPYEIEILRNRITNVWIFLVLINRYHIWYIV